jgi:hypothetical protein
MAETENFGRLYRAALAETDPEKKSHLLRAVQLVLLQWHEEAARAAASELSQGDPAFADSAA